MSFIPRWLLDMGFAIVVFAVGIGGTCLPKLIYHMGKRVNGNGLMLFHLGNAMSGGAMVGGALCHLLPDSMEDIGTISYPLAGALAGLGYILTMMMEAVATSIADSVGVSHCHQLEDSPEDLEGIWVQDVYDSFDEIPHQDHADSTEFTEEFGINTESPVYTPHNGREEKKGSFIAALTLGIALSYHSILSGMAMGSQVTVQATLNLMYVIIAHKGLEAYALGSSLVNSHATQTKIWLLTIAYSTAMPVGILTGYLLFSGTGNIVTGILSGLSAGTFLFVGIGEVITTEMANPSHRFKKILCILIGFGLMAVLPVLE